MATSRKRFESMNLGQGTTDHGLYHKVEVKEEVNMNENYNSGDFCTKTENELTEHYIFKRPRLNTEPYRRIGVRTGIVNGCCDIKCTGTSEHKKNVLRQPPSGMVAADPCSPGFFGDFKELKWDSDLQPLLREVKSEECLKCKCSQELMAPEVKPSTTVVTEDDSLKMFFEAMYRDTKALPPHLQIRTKRVLFQAVADAQDLAGMTDPPSLQSTHQVPPPPQRTATPSRNVSSSEQVASDSTLPG
ncbi:hypothetical protein AAG570_010804 [Ranatra chinensis]|uniref:Uncharacterized protein n=1 Tax=Ranatra chinensis TaxID=642074 RepID=A0ABD0YZI8_9HEMI